MHLVSNPQRSTVYSIDPDNDLSNPSSEGKNSPISNVARSCIEEPRATIATDFAWKVNSKLADPENTNEKDLARLYEVAMVESEPISEGDGGELESFSRAIPSYNARRVRGRQVIPFVDPNPNEFQAFAGMGLQPVPVAMVEASGWDLFSNDYIKNPYTTEPADQGYVMVDAEVLKAEVEIPLETLENKIPFDRPSSSGSTAPMSSDGSNSPRQISGAFIDEMHRPAPIRIRDKKVPSILEGLRNRIAIQRVIAAVKKVPKNVVKGLERARDQAEPIVERVVTAVRMSPETVVEGLQKARDHAEPVVERVAQVARNLFSNRSARIGF